MPGVSEDHILREAKQVQAFAYGFSKIIRLVGARPSQAHRRAEPQGVEDLSVNRT